jgi:hypothetical protein
MFQNSLCTTGDSIFKYDSFKYRTVGLPKHQKKTTGHEKKKHLFRLIQKKHERSLCCASPFSFVSSKLLDVDPYPWRFLFQYARCPDPELNTKQQEQ